MKIKLSKKDLGNSLSALKKTKQPKNVLVKNLSDYWPCLSDSQKEKFTEIINNLCKDNEIGSAITKGLYSTLRNLNRSKISFLMMADEISPKWFGKHLISMALSKNQSTKVVLISRMKEMTRDIFKVPAIVWGIKNDADEKKLEELSTFYDNLNTHNEFIKYYYTICPVKDYGIKMRKKKKANEEQTITPIIHLRKKEDLSPAFVPAINKTTPMEIEESSDFISLAKFDDPALSNLAPYRPMRINKIIGNLKRKANKS